MAQKDNIVTVKCKVENGILVPVNEGNARLQDTFIKGLQSNQRVIIFMEACNDNGTSLQLAKIHVLIRKIAIESGTTFNDIKHEVKIRSGLTYDTYEKSFEDCSTEELALVLETIKVICNALNIIF